MKQKDIALIIVVVAISAAMSFVVCSQIFGATKHDQQAEVVEAISSEFQTPDKKYFNSSAYDPTQTITIQQNTNPDPFRGTGQ